MAGGQKLAPSVGALDHQMGGTLMPLASDHPHQLLYQRMMRRRNPNPFDVTGRRLLSLMVAVAAVTSVAATW
jgi:hypothetical protein